jgi:hypothetical protein
VQNPVWLREQANRIFAMAKEARETGNAGIAALLIDAATRYLEQAVALESAKAAKAPTNDGPVTLQQQQIQQATD